MMSTTSDLNLLRLAFTRGAEAKMPPKVEGGILQVCLNLNQSEVGFHRVNLLKYEFSFSTLQSRKNILRVCVIISCETIILEHYKPVEHFVIYE